MNFEELEEIWFLFRERYLEPKKPIKSEAILFWKLKKKIETIQYESIEQL